MTASGRRVIVYAHTDGDGEVTAGALEAAAWARRLGTTEAVSLGALPDAALSRLGDCGVTAVHVADPPGWASHLPAGPAAAAIATLAPSVIVLPSTRDGRDLAGRLAVRLGAAVVAQVEDAAVEPPITLHSVVFGGRVAVSTRVALDRPAIALLAPGCCAAPPARGAGPPTVVPIRAPVAGARPVRLVASRAEPGGATLEQAGIVVSGGRGLGDAGGFELVREAADLLGGAVGASRAAVDAGWVPHAAQVGQSGTTVAPAVYIACGISGAMQHAAGMRRSRHVIAINSDRAAPIFALADLGVVGDASGVLRQLVAELRRRRELPPT